MEHFILMKSTDILVVESISRRGTKGITCSSTPRPLRKNSAHARR